ncbi:hypothetical protein C3477_20345 [Mycobacterium kansasii]|nr:hypothetical protein C3B43_07710 [Mycobacterium kansasii]POY00771.1 hypothetical protein C3477_20345 [Mycobacterium kansasii]POY23973.1 hypothetical protein C3476_05710 [Mycobacterium kansasii]
MLCQWASWPYGQWASWPYGQWATWPYAKHDIVFRAMRSAHGAENVNTWMRELGHPHRDDKPLHGEGLSHVAGSLRRKDFGLYWRSSARWSNQADNARDSVRP